MNNQEGMWGSFYRISEKIMYACYLNFLWIIFTVLGLGVFGFMPATVAMYTVYRKFLLGESHVRIFKLFATTYKNEFIKSNLFGLLLIVVGYVLYVDFVFLSTLSGFVGTLLTGVFLIAALLYLILALYLIPVYVHYDLKFFQYIKQSILIGFISPLMTISMLLGLFLLYLLFDFIPGLIPLFFFSVIGFCIMGNAHVAFMRLERKKEALKEQTAENAS
ncbi:YesL family protein [Halalkalibacter hemicellulosilyticus]|uniref:YESV protein n=1 Tax=Halalkalibacter hemicellulosilyticusJCM 9152 TaxID=1236971 RepID=W4QI70_9BACI|nr:YesL family protein [Halalkalibacter hemicellulosilyticus]GAE31019.1 hypothetical protein JCM9152_2457 [Halalkalibacter hemicellulosilyticusJCM 9152]